MINTWILEHYNVEGSSTHIRNKSDDRNVSEHKIILTMFNIKQMNEGSYDLAYYVVKGMYVGWEVPEFNFRRWWNF